MEASTQEIFCDLGGSEQDSLGKGAKHHLRQQPTCPCSFSDQKEKELYSRLLNNCPIIAETESAQ